MRWQAKIIWKYFLIVIYLHDAQPFGVQQFCLSYAAIALA
jgi:hypothetical protein